MKHFKKLNVGLLLRWPADSQSESGRFARINSHESIRNNNPYLHNIRAIRANRFKPATRDVLVPQTRFAKERGSVQRANQAT